MRQRDHRPLGASEDDPSVWRKAAGKMNAEVSGMFLEGTMDVVAILAVRHNPAFGNRESGLELHRSSPLNGSRRRLRTANNYSTLRTPNRDDSQPLGRRSFCASGRM